MREGRNVLETNLRIVRPGPGLWVTARYAKLEGATPSPDQMESVCGKLRHRYGVAAAPLSSESSTLVVASQKPVPTIELKDPNWSISVRDAGESVRLTLGSSLGDRLIPLLVERSLLARIAHQKSRWAIAGLPRHWYEPKPFVTCEGIKAYRRIAVGTLIIDEIGVGVAVDVETAYFTERPLAWFFDGKQTREERGRRRKLFAKLSARAQGQGTLLYNNGRTLSSCYFSEAPDQMTCSTTPAITAHGKTYPSLFDYYKAENPALSVTEDTPAVYVSFKLLDRPQPVAADKVWLRVFNDSLPDSVRGLNQIDPDTRRNYIKSFWEEIGPQPLGRVAPGFQDGFWRPPSQRIWHIPAPDLEFGQQRRLRAPRADCSDAARASYYKDRLEMLEGGGCYDLPLAVRTLHCVYSAPDSADSELEQASGQLAKDVCERISNWTSKSFSSNLESYQDVRQCVERFQQLGKYSLSSGTILFVLNNEPAAYYEVSLGLADWRPKRVTQSKLIKHYGYLKKGVWHRNGMSIEKGKRKWERYVTMVALKVLQQIDGVPWRIPSVGSYEAQLVIDVGHNRRQYAMSLLVARPKEKTPDFGIFSQVFLKIDHDKEEINASVLEEEIVNFFRRELKAQSSTSYHALASLLVLRDGRLCGEEYQAIDRAIKRLIALGLFVADPVVDIAAFYKDSLKSVRLWEVTSDEKAVNVRAGTALKIKSSLALLANTGRETLGVRQGTVEPVMIETNGHCSSLTGPVEAAHASSHLNWSSPIVAQRLGLPFKRTDEELKARLQQEIRHIK